MSKRWNQKGTSHAKERMAELRLRKLEYARSDLAREYEARFGRHWFCDAKAVLPPTSEPMNPQDRVGRHIDWLRQALA